MSACRYESHPGVPLKEHLRAVGALCREYASGSAPGRLAQVAEVAGACHDVGKYSVFFQRRLRGLDPPSPLSAHSELSALTAAWVVYERLGECDASCMAYIAVRFHHSRLSSDVAVRNRKALRRQARSIRGDAGEVYPELAYAGVPEAARFIDSFDSELGRVEEVVKLGLLEARRKREFASLLFLYSCLVDADRKHAGGPGARQAAGRLSSLDIQAYSSSLGGPGELNELRRLLFRETAESIRRLGAGGGPVFTLTAPAGLGKTLAGANAALALSEMLGGRRVIYALPYIAIIDQVYDDLERIYAGRYGTRDPYGILRHHHLAFAGGEGEGASVDDALLLADSWDSHLVVTSFERLFASVINCRRQDLRRLHNIAGSVILLDEVQAIPVEYWELVREAMSWLTGFGSRVIFMTATSPAMFSGTELVPRHAAERFRRINRVELTADLSGSSKPEAFAEYVADTLPRGGSALAVLNTVKSSRKVYETLKGRFGDGLRVIYLSAMLAPVDRLPRINAVRKLLLERRPVLLVSTQVVEAGVDLDFNAAYRDLGPIDSIIQVAGRCNRNMGPQRGTVHVKRVGEDAELVYGLIHASTSAKLLGENPRICEPEFHDLCQRYFAAIADAKGARGSPKSRSVLGAAWNMDFRRLDGFTLIENQHRTPVFLELDENATRLLHRLRELANTAGDPFERRRSAKRLFAEMSSYIVDAPTKTAAKLEKFMDAIPYVRMNEIEAYYDREIGFKTEDDETIIW